MKNFIKYIFILLNLITCCTNTFAQKIAYIETDSIIYQMSEYKNLTLELMNYKGVLTKELENKQSELEHLYHKMIDTLNTYLVTPEHQRKMEKQLAEKQEEIKRLNLQITEIIILKEKESIHIINQIFNKILAEVAQENGYDYIINKKDILYINDGIDVSDKVKIKLGL